MLTPQLRGLQAFLALQLAATLAIGHEAVGAALAYEGPRSPLSAWGIYPLLVRDHPLLGTAVVCALLLLAAVGLWPRVLVPVQFWLRSEQLLSVGPALANSRSVIATCIGRFGR